jgi:hypothetical protein
MVRGEFAKHKDEKDEARIEGLKSGAIRALSNYMLFASGTKDDKLGKAMDNFNDTTRKEGGGVSDSGGSGESTKPNDSTSR